MIPTARSVEEAMEWFLANSSGELLCVRADGEQRKCNCFPDAKAFFAA